MVAVVACVYKTGGDFTVEYVRRLHEGVKAHCDRPFVCFSDNPDAVRFCDEYIPLEHNLPGWWSKLEAFRLDSALYLDLDTIVKGDIQALCEYPHKFTMLRDFNRKNKHPTSGVMAWSGDYSYLLEGITAKAIAHYDTGKPIRGDQRYISDNICFEPERLQDLFPGIVESYKWRKHPSPDAKIVCYHGKPRPHDIGWAE